MDIIARYLEAYKKRYGKDTTVTRSSSWYYIGDDKVGIRKWELEHQLSFLLDDISELGKPESKEPEQREPVSEPIPESSLQQDTSTYVCKSCAGKVVVQDTAVDFTYCPYCGYAGGMTLENCPDCATEPGHPHNIGCKIERCSVCGERKFGCGCSYIEHDSQFARWTGISPGEAESHFIGIPLKEFLKTYSSIFFIRPTTKPKVKPKKPNFRTRTLPANPLPPKPGQTVLKLDFDTKLDERLCVEEDLEP